MSRSLSSRLFLALSRLDVSQCAWLSVPVLGDILGEDVTSDAVLAAARELCEAGFLEERAMGSDDQGGDFDLDAEEYAAARKEGVFICPVMGEPRPVEELSGYFAVPET